MRWKIWSACDSLFDDLETKRGVIDLLGRAERAEGVRIFIGSENKLFSLSGSSTIIAPYQRRRGPHRRRARRDRADAAELCAGDPDGGLCRAHRQPDAGWLIRPAESGTVALDFRPLKHDIPGSKSPFNPDGSFEKADL